jgi:hypothetical protein
MYEEPILFLSVDTPRRDPKDIIFVNPEDGTRCPAPADRSTVKEQDQTALRN